MKKIKYVRILSLLMLLLFLGCARREVVEVKKALLIVAPENFRDEEALYTKEELEKAGIQVDVASTRKGT